MHDAVIIGAGPSGLAAAYEMGKKKATTLIVEKDKQVGGLAKTIEFDNCLFDVGPHRFFTKNKEVEQLFKDVVAEDTVNVNRLTRILYNNKLFNYPLTPVNALFGVGVGASFGIMASYAGTRLKRRIDKRPPANFEQWVSDQFGQRLYETFFKTYTEKVWGISCTQIGAEWAQQRIKGLNLVEAIKNALFPSHTGKIKSLVDRFMYPRLGAGQFYEKWRDIILKQGGELASRQQVVKLIRDGKRIKAVVTQGAPGHNEIPGRFFLCSQPLTELVRSFDPPPPSEVLRACDALRYRDHLSVQLKTTGIEFPDNWIYVHAKELAMARISNYRNFSPEMTKGADVHPLTVEYFCFKGDRLWSMTDEQLIQFAMKELNSVRIGKKAKLISGTVLRNEKAYPVIEEGYEQHISVIRSWLGSLENLLPIGRSGMFKYNNQDHAIATGLLAARTVLGLGKFDPWLVNIDAEYHETIRQPA